jgi:hypothetical protein
MMAERVPGPICGSKVGDEWIDDGTLCRSQSSVPGPLGMVLSLVMGAAPVSDEQAETKILIDGCIDIIEKSPFIKTPDGPRIVKKLRELNKSGNIQYGGTLEDSRGDWDGTTIRLNADFRGKAYRSVPELVHEASHAVWKKDPKKRETEVGRREDDIDDELRSRENQLAIYVHLKDKLKWREDFELERRLQQLKSKTLRKAIEDNYGGAHNTGL